jgi:hypothetical protein
MGTADYAVGLIGLALALIALMVGKPLERRLAHWLSNGNGDEDNDKGDDPPRG